MKRLQAIEGHRIQFERLVIELELFVEMLSDILARRRLRASFHQIHHMTSLTQTKRQELERLIINFRDYMKTEKLLSSNPNLISASSNPPLDEFRVNSNSSSNLRRRFGNSSPRSNSFRSPSSRILRSSPLSPSSVNRTNTLGQSSTHVALVPTSINNEQEYNLEDNIDADERNLYEILGMDVIDSLVLENAFNLHASSSSDEEERDESIVKEDSEVTNNPLNDISSSIDIESINIESIDVTEKTSTTTSQRKRASPRRNTNHSHRGIEEELNVNQAILLSLQDQIHHSSPSINNISNVHDPSSTSSETSNNITMLMNMGFEEELIRTTLAACNDNIDLAINRLLE